MQTNVFVFQDKLQLVSVLGAGLLVGTALSVIIPEGVRVLFTASGSGGLRESKCKFLYKFYTHTENTTGYVLIHGWNRETCK